MRRYAVPLDTIIEHNALEWDCVPDIDVAGIIFGECIEQPFPFDLPSRIDTEKGNAACYMWN